MEKSLDLKLDKIRRGDYKPSDFIIADAKDSDMGGGIRAFGKQPGDDGRANSLPHHLEAMRRVTASGLVDVMLMSANAAERLVNEGVFEDSSVTPAVRLNDTSDIWGARHSSYNTQPARNFRSARLEHVAPMVDLGLYSLTFSNDLERDLDSLEQFHYFLDDISGSNLRYFLEVFNPQIDTGIARQDLPAYVNDCIVRCLAGLTSADHPAFLKIPFNGPAAMDELCQYDPGNLIVGVLGGSAGTTRDTLELVRQSEKYGARVALFGRKILFSEDPEYLMTMMRAVVQGDMTTKDAVKAFHAHLAKQSVRPRLKLGADLQVTESALMHDQ